ncbi:MAG: SUMF1/EgtB/PvdO family nonheme iron enzyme [Planctomycetales bacterium]|nr:SUMF1/EgtB/PvdO family nonheme iron enzyme [Planctomycetales bacterium]
MPNRSTQRFEMCVTAACLVAWVALSGCGDSAKPAGQGLIQVQPPASASAPASDASGKAADGAAKSDSAVAQRSGKEMSRDARRFENLSPFDDSGLPDENFVASEFDPTADHERWVVAVPDKRANEADLFAVVIPTGGADSSQFDFLARPKPSSASADFRLPDGFTIVDEVGWSAEGLPQQIRCEKDGSIMVLVSAGSFLQGTNAGAPDLAPEHAVELDAYYIDQAEVSNARFEKFRADVRDTKRVAAPVRSTGNPREPAMGIAWVDALAYAHWAGKELPTEAQWEKAARGASGFSYPWGNGRPVWQRARQPGQIDVAMSFPGDVSPFGAFDLAGNAREWCADWYSDSTYKQAVSGGVIPKNPSGPKTSTTQRQRVVKGGAATWLLWSRAGVPLSDRPVDVGFRCAWTPKPVAAVGETEDDKAGKAKKPAPTKPGAASKTKSGGF